MARWIKLRVKPGRGLHSFSLEPGERGVHLRAGDEFIVSYANAGIFLRDRGTRTFEIIDDFETDSETPPDGTISIGRLDEPLG